MHIKAQSDIKENTSMSSPRDKKIIIGVRVAVATINRALAIINDWCWVMDAEIIVRAATAIKTIHKPVSN